jgi:delta 1-pyrroline-5-carboxylate dehydrogenase
MREETFGPILPIMKVHDEAEATRLANDSIYGLSASVWSEDLKRAERVAQALEVGSVAINDALAHYAVPQLPFGGMKQSGNTRTHGRHEVLQFTQVQARAVGRIPVSLDIAVRLRQPDNYYLMRAILHALFGASLRQRLRAAPDLATHLRREPHPKPQMSEGQTSNSWLPALAGAVAGLVMLLVAALRGRK